MKWVHTGGSEVRFQDTHAYRGDIVELSWDPEKRRKNLINHGFDFADAETVFKGAIFSFEDKRKDYGEQRFIALGMLEGVVVVIICTEPREDLIRIISMRKATKHEQDLYFRRITY